MSASRLEGSWLPSGEKVVAIRQAEPQQVAQQGIVTRLQQLSTWIKQKANPVAPTARNARGMSSEPDMADQTLQAAKQKLEVAAVLYWSSRGYGNDCASRINLHGGYRGAMISLLEQITVNPRSTHGEVAVLMARLWLRRKTRATGMVSSSLLVIKAVSQRQYNHLPNNP